MHIFFLTVQLIFSTLSAREATCSVQGPSAPHTGNIVICGKRNNPQSLFFFFPSSFQTANQKIRLNVCFCRKTEDNRQKTGGRRGGEDEGGEGRGGEWKGRAEHKRTKTLQLRPDDDTRVKQNSEQTKTRSGVEEDVTRENRK